MAPFEIVKNQNGFHFPCLNELLFGINHVIFFKSKWNSSSIQLKPAQLTIDFWKSQILDAKN